MEKITWTNCAEQMPPRFYKGWLIIKKWDASFVSIEDAPFIRKMIPYPVLWEWTYYTPEKWKELNKCAD